MNVVSFGGGTNSTAMIIGMYLHKIPIDLILFADTGGEQTHTYEFMGTFNEWLVKHGLNCSDCAHEGKAVHDVFLCTGFDGSVKQYVANWKRKQMEELGGGQE